MEATNYVVETNRLGMREWREPDWIHMHSINQDIEVMKFFPTLSGKEDTKSFIQRMQESFKQFGYCYFATEIKKTQEFIGFIGLQNIDFEADFTPATDIGWRLKRSSWNKGYATEGAREVLKFGFGKKNLQKIVSLAPQSNQPSIKVMEKIGIKRVKEFTHPKLLAFPRLMLCDLYSVKKEEMP